MGTWRLVSFLGHGADGRETITCGSKPSRAFDIRARDVGRSLARYGLGFLRGNVFGVLLGILTGHSRVARDTLGVLLNFARSTPTIVLIPVAMV
ncbi:MAG: hypothetical protein ACRD26_11020 [Vicinamibacterales bacterium]